MSMARIGESLDPKSTLEAQARRARRAAPICRECGLPSFPRGYCLNLGRCWTCVFPRSP